MRLLSRHLEDRPETRSWPRPTLAGEMRSMGPSASMAEPEPDVAAETHTPQGQEVGRPGRSYAPSKDFAPIWSVQKITFCTASIQSSWSSAGIECNSINSNITTI